MKAMILRMCVTEKHKSHGNFITFSYFLEVE